MCRLRCTLKLKPPVAAQRSSAFESGSAGGGSRAPARASFKGAEAPGAPAPTRSHTLRTLFVLSLQSPGLPFNRAMHQAIIYDSQLVPAYGRSCRPRSGAAGGKGGAAGALGKRVLTSDPMLELYRTGLLSIKDLHALSRCTGSQVRWWSS